MRDKRAVAADPVLAPDRRLAERFAFAAHIREVFPQLFDPFGCEQDGIGRFGGTLCFRFRRRHDRADAQQGAEAQVQAQQDEQGDEVPALEDTVKPQQQDDPVEGAVGLRVPGDLPPLRDHGADHRAEADERQQQKPEAHGAQVIEYFFHGAYPLYKGKGAPPSAARRQVVRDQTVRIRSAVSALVQMFSARSRQS